MRYWDNFLDGAKVESAECALTQSKEVNPISSVPCDIDIDRQERSTGCCCRYVRLTTHIMCIVLNKELRYIRVL